MSQLLFIDGDEEFYQNYEMGKIISKGVSTVMSATNKQNQSTNAAKVNQSLQFQNQITIIQDEEDIKTFQNQVKIIKTLQTNPHPYIVNYHGYYLMQDGSVLLKYELFRKTKLGCLFMELGVTSFDLYISRQTQENKYLHPEQLISIIKLNFIFLKQFRGTSSAILHLEQLQIAHQNIKPENLILTNLQTFTFKFCDVTDGIQTTSGKNTRTWNLAGSVSFMSPELYDNFTKLNYQVRYNPFKSDLFSLALLWIYAGTFFRFSYQARQELNQQKFDQAILNLIYSIVHRYPMIVGLENLLSQCLAIDPSQRIELKKLTLLIEQLQIDNTNPLIQSDISCYKTLEENERKDHQGYIQFRIPKEYSKLGFYNCNPQLCEKAHFNLNELWVMPNDFQMMCEKLYYTCENLNLKSLKFSLEMNGIDERQVGPIQKIISHFNKISEFQIFCWKQILKQ